MENGAKEDKTGLVCPGCYDSFINKVFYPMKIWCHQNQLYS